MGGREQAPAAVQGDEGGEEEEGEDTKVSS